MGIEHWICERCHRRMFDGQREVGDPPAFCPHCGANQAIEKNIVFWRVALIAVILVLCWKLFEF